jgi:cytochrome c biogenesis factor
MIPEIGEFALIIALFLSVVLALVPMYGASTANEIRHLAVGVLCDIHNREIILRKCIA